MELRIEKVDKKEVYIIDDLLEKEEIDAFYEFVTKLAFSRSEKSTAYDEFPKFVADFDPEKFENQTFLGKKARELFRQFFPDLHEHYMFRVYVNLSNYGDVEWPHKDCPSGRGDVTILYYINAEWHYKYGGETLFYQDKEPLIPVLPKPGRFVLFEGDIEHIGGLPNRICKKSRYSLAIKYKRNEN